MVNYSALIIMMVIDGPGSVRFGKQKVKKRKKKKKKKKCVGFVRSG